ncbi:DUF2442 domain-containing protein [Methylomonas paludis]|uniref:DUF2442 domain-containing protein n=1 Tax=Methylomonas paludis TaxID=1173101 RepID=A0A975MPP1_9GAMM|nr:DUF2442 domain-containing protein [Methylomonas paludis]QWF71505.1 DUF2442 domain-containing protein [Methylomonas paludis]
MAITKEEFVAANQRGKKAKAILPSIVSVKYDRRISRIVIALSSGLDLSFAPKSAQGLEHAHPADLTDIEVTPSGLGIHFPKLDADIYIPALLEGFLGSKQWLVEQGRKGGKASTAAKVAAARENGKLGGRRRTNQPVIV